MMVTSSQIQTLAFAAYEIFHAISEHRNPCRRDLIFDTFLIKDEFRGDWNKLVRRDANFFKHGDRDPEATLNFDPEFSEWFILYASVARQLCGMEQTSEESLFLWWFQINRPDFLTDAGKKFVAERIQPPISRASGNLQGASSAKGGFWPNSAAKYP